MAKVCVDEQTKQKPNKQFTLPNTDYGDI